MCRVKPEGWASLHKALVKLAAVRALRTLYKHGLRYTKKIAAGFYGFGEILFHLLSLSLSLSLSLYIYGDITFLTMSKVY